MTFVLVTEGMTTQLTDFCPVNIQHIMVGNSVWWWKRPACWQWGNENGRWEKKEKILMLPCHASAKEGPNFIPVGPVPGGSVSSSSALE